MFILFRVKFPDSMNPNQIEQIGDVLHNQMRKDSNTDMDDSEIVKLTKYNEG